MKFATTKERIIQLIDYKLISKKKFYEKTGLKRGILDTDKLKTSILDIYIAKIIAIYPEINPLWLLTGKGDMLIEDSSNIVNESAPTYDKPATNVIEIRPDTANTNTLIADVHASAGFGSLMASASSLEQLPAIHLPNAPLGLNIAFQINGDSMHPTIRHLDYVAANQVTDLAEIKDGYTYILVDDIDGVICKRLYSLGADWQIVSDNPTYPPYNRRKNRIIGVYKAFCRWSYDFQSYHDDVRKDITQMKADIRTLKMHT